MQRGMGGRPMTDQFNDGLDFGQSMALLNEAQSAQNLLRDTVGAIVRLRHPIVHGDSVFTLGSIGVEKLMKIVLGLVHLRGSGTWPTVKVMKSWGHGVLDMDALVASTLEANMAAATHRPYVEKLVKAHQADQHWPLLSAVFDRYGQSGRFYYLDHLARGQPDKWEAPVEFWNRLELCITDGQPNILTMIAGEQGEAERGYARLSLVSATSLDKWWFIIHRAAIQGCFGERGKTIGWEIWPHGREVLE